MTLSFVLLALAVCAVWIKDVKISNIVVPLWVVALTAAMVSGVINQYVEIIGVGWIVLLGFLTFFEKRTAAFRIRHALHLVFIGCMALLLAMGKLPGFHNPSMATDITLSPAGERFNFRLNFNSIATGVILLALICKPIKTWSEWLATVRQSGPIIFVTLIVVLGTALAINYVAVDVKFYLDSWVFLISNLLFTCVMEESFFRGFVQKNFLSLSAKWKYGVPLSIASASFLFGLAHFRGGLVYIGLATLAGIFYGYAHYRTKRIEAAILTHFSVNALHFIAFSYPHL